VKSVLLSIFLLMVVPMPAVSHAQAGKDAAAPPEQCSRGKPTRMLKSGSGLRILSETEARETVQSASPIKLSIHHSGCAHYVVDFRFSWVGRQMPLAQQAIQEAAKLLQGLPFDATYEPIIESLVIALEKAAQDPEKPIEPLSEMETVTVTTPEASVLNVRYNVAL
jgi:hypothetical protein